MGQSGCSVSFFHPATKPNVRRGKMKIARNRKTKLTSKHPPRHPRRRKLRLCWHVFLKRLQILPPGVPFAHRKKHQTSASKTPGSMWIAYIRVSRRARSARNDARRKPTRLSWASPGDDTPFAASRWYFQSNRKPYSFRRCFGASKPRAGGGQPHFISVSACRSLVEPARSALSTRWASNTVF